MQPLKELSKRRSVLFAKTLATNLRWSPLTPVLGGGTRACITGMAVAVATLHANGRPQISTEMRSADKV